MIAPTRSARLFWIVLLCAGCGGPEEELPDTTPPGVLSTDPPHGATGVAPDVKVRIAFDEAIDRNTLNRDMFHLEDQNLAALWGSVSYDLALHQATLSLLAPLSAGKSYQAVLQSGVKDLAGNRMSQAYRWSFTVTD